MQNSDALMNAAEADMLETWEILFLPRRDSTEPNHNAHVRTWDTEAEEIFRKCFPWRRCDSVWREWYLFKTGRP